MTERTAEFPGNFTPDRAELLLRLPVGVKLAAEGWSPADLPPEEKEDPTGPWNVYQKSVPVQAEGEVLVREPVRLSVTEEGVNWIISSRVRVLQGRQALQAFGVVFATLQGKEGEFHAIPKGPIDTQSAQAS